MECCLFEIVLITLISFDSLQSESLRTPRALFHQSGTVAVTEDLLKYPQTTPFHMDSRKIPEVDDKIVKCQVMKTLQAGTKYMFPSTYGRLNTTKIVFIIMFKLMYAHQDFK